VQRSKRRDRPPADTRLRSYRRMRRFSSSTTRVRDRSSGICVSFPRRFESLSGGFPGLAGWMRLSSYHTPDTRYPWLRDLYETCFGRIRRSPIVIITVRNYQYPVRIDRLRYERIYGLKQSPGANGFRRSTGSYRCSARKPWFHAEIDNLHPETIATGPASSDSRRVVNCLMNDRKPFRPSNRLSPSQPSNRLRLCSSARRS